MAGPGSREGRSEPETKIIKERRGSTVCGRGHHEVRLYCEPQRAYGVVKRCWPVSRSGGKEAIGNRERYSTFLPPYFVICVEERGICGNTFLRAEWISINRGEKRIQRI